MNHTSLAAPLFLVACKVRSGHRVGSRGCKEGGDDESDERYENNKGEEGEDGTKLDRERYASFYFRAYIKLTKSKKNN